VKVRVQHERALIALGNVAAPGATLETARLVLTGEPPDLADLQLPRDFAFELAGGRVEDARALTARLPPPLRLLGGKGTFTAHVQGPITRASGFVNLDLRQVALDARNEVFHADVVLDARIATLDVRHGADLSGTTLAVERGGIKREPDARTWWGRFTLPVARVRFTGDEIFDADLRAQCRDARPIVGLYARLGSLPGSTKRLFTMEGLQVEGSAAAGREWLVLRDLHAKGEGAEVRAVFRRIHDDEEGAAWLKVGIVPLAIGLGKNHSGVQLVGPGDFFTERQAALGRAPELPSLRHRKK
jgi:hypothetical protein